MAPPTPEFEKQMLYLEAEIRRLEAEFNMFFAGRLPRPPWETRARVAALVKKHDQGFITNTADRFRFESLQARYQKFLELWERQMAHREVGRAAPAGRRPPTNAPSAPAAPDARDAPATPAVEHIVRFAPASDADDRVRELYEHLAEARKATGEAPVAFDRVAALVHAQVEKYGGHQVDFKVALKSGKVSLTVKAVKTGA